MHLRIWSACSSSIRRLCGFNYEPREVSILTNAIDDDILPCDLRTIGLLSFLNASLQHSFCSCELKILGRGCHVVNLSNTWKVTTMRVGTFMICIYEAHCDILDNTQPSVCLDEGAVYSFDISLTH